MFSLSADSDHLSATFGYISKRMDLLRRQFTRALFVLRYTFNKPHRLLKKAEAPTNPNGDECLQKEIKEFVLAYNCGLSTIHSAESIKS